MSAGPSSDDAITGPRTSSGMPSKFCVNSWTWIRCMTSTSAVAASPFAISSTARAVVARPAPTPPSAAGTVRLPSPVAHTAATLSCENVPSRS